MDAIADTVDLLVELRAVVVAVLTSAGHSEAHAGRVPGTNASDLAETTVRLALELLDAPTEGDTLEALALGHGNDVDVLVLVENGLDGHLLLEETLGEVHLVSDGAAVDL